MVLLTAVYEYSYSEWEGQICVGRGYIVKDGTAKTYSLGWFLYLQHPLRNTAPRADHDIGDAAEIDGVGLSEERHGLSRVTSPPGPTYATNRNAVC